MCALARMGEALCVVKWRFPSQGLNVWPRDLDGFISLGADRLYREKVER